MTAGSAVTERFATGTDPRTERGKHRVAPARDVPMRRLLGEQAAVVGGQLAAGAGNMAFSLLAAHALPAGAFAELATFLALYLLLMIPSSGLAAAAAANPDAVRTRKVAIASVLIGAAIALGCAPVGAALHLQPVLVALLGAALPAVTLLAIERGRLYGRHQQLLAVATLVAEPAVRLSAGAAGSLGIAGAVGAAAPVVVGGYLALAIAKIGRRRHAAAGAGAAETARPDKAMVVAFVAMSVLQNVDVILANRLLPSGAGTFAAVSTLGGVAAFATATIPLVLLPRVRPGSTDTARALGAAFAAVLVLGAGIVAVTAVASPHLYATVLGPHYAGIAHLAVPYVAIMALFGFVRVLAARQCGAGLGRVVLPVLWVAIAVQTGWIALFARTPGAVAGGTEAAVLAAATALGTTQVVRLRRARRVATTTRVSRVRTSRRDLLLVLALTCAAAVLRMLITRGLWVDEATSVAQANMSYGGMLHNLRTTDVHPPGYFTILWAWVRLFGDGPLAVRMPSILFGVALVPAMFAAARELFGLRTARVAAVLTVLAPQAVWYSQEARMYSLFMLLVVLAVWAQARIIRTGSWRAWAAYTGATIGLLYTQYFTTLVVLAQQLIFVAMAVRARRRQVPIRAQLLRWGASAVVVLLAVAPLVPFVWHQFAVNQAAGKGFGAPTNTGAGASSAANGPSIYALLANFIWIGVGYHSDAVMTELGAMWPLAMLLLLCLLGRGRSMRALLVAVVGLLPIAVLFTVGQAKSFVFDMRYFIGAVPMAVLLTARAVTKWPLRRVGMIAVSAVVVLALGSGLYDQQLNGQNPRRYDFAPALEKISATATPNAEVVLSPPYLDTVSRYYEPHLRYVLDQGGTTAVSRRVGGTHEVFVMGSFFSNGDQRGHTRALVHALAQHRRVVRVWNFDNVKVWELR